MTDTLLTQLAQRLAREPDARARVRARLHLLDWLACIAGARGKEASDLGCVISQRSWEKATYMGNVLGAQDVHRAAGVYPGPVIWPAANSYESAGLETRIDAAIRGYEAMIAVGLALDTAKNDIWDATTVCGMIGSAASFGAAIGFAPTEFAQAMGNAASVAGGLHHMHHDDVLTAQWHIFHAVRTGRDAALHVHYGATGPKGILEGPQGLFAAMAPEAGGDTNGGAGVLGEKPGSWLIHDVSFTKWLANGADDPELPPDEAHVIAKLEAMIALGELGNGEADKAARIALQGDDAQELDRLLENWMR